MDINNPIIEWPTVDKTILVEALVYWAYDLEDIDDEFDRFDQRRNRAVAMIEALCADENLINLVDLMNNLGINCPKLVYCSLSFRCNSMIRMEQMISQVRSTSSISVL